VVSGVFAARVQRGGAVPMPLEQKFAFSRKEGQASVFVQWDPKEKKDAVAWFEVYDAGLQEDRPQRRHEDQAASAAASVSRPGRWASRPCRRASTGRHAARQRAGVAGYLRVTE